MYVLLWTGVSNERRLFAEDTQTKRHRCRQNVVQGQKVAENDPRDIRVIRHMLLTDHH